MVEQKIIKMILMYLFGLSDSDKNNGITDKGVHIMDNDKNLFVRMNNMW